MRALLLLIFIVPFIAKSQSFVPDENGYVRDKKFIGTIAKRQYKLVSGFDTIGKIVRAFVIKNDTLKYIDLSLNEFKYIGDHKLRMKSFEDSASAVYNFHIVDLSNRYKKTTNTKGKYGLYDNFKSKQFLKEEFDGVLPIKCGYIFFLKNNGWGAIDSFGNIVIPAKYSNIRSVGLKPLQVDYFVVSDSIFRDSLMIIDKHNHLISQFKYKSVNSDCGGKNFICTRKGDSSLIYQLVDLKGNELLTHNYEKIWYNQYMNWFECTQKKANLFDIVDASGKYLQRNMESDNGFNGPNYNANNFSCYYFVKFANAPHFSILNKEGKVILESNKDVNPLNSEFKYFIKLSPDSLPKRRFLGLIDVNNNILLPSIYQDLTPLNKSRILLVDKNYKAYIYNLELRKIDTINYNLDWRNPHNYNITCSNSMGKHGVINFNNKVIIPFNYSILDNANKYFYTENSVITSKGKVVLEHIYKHSEVFNRFNYRNDFHEYNGLFIFDISETEVEICDRYNHKLIVSKSNQLFKY